MALLADRILEDALSEITLRDPSFLDRHSLGFAPLPVLVERYAATPLFSPFGAAGIEAHLAAGLSSLSDRAVRSTTGAAAETRLGRVICDSLMDGLAAEAGAIGLRAPPRRPEPLARVLEDDYEARTTAGGARYLVRRGGGKWLLVVNAVGIPLGVWSRLLGDRDHGYRVLVVEGAGSDLVHGGMRERADLASDVARIVQVLEAEAVEAVHVAGWCSGGRVAVQLAAEQPERVRSLTLVSTTFRGAAGSDAGPTPFEEDIGGILDSVARAPESAGFLSQLLAQSNTLAQPPAEDAQLFRLPALDQAAALAAPLSTGPDLTNYCLRIAGDKAHATAAALARVRAPILAVAGRHDHVLSNDHTWGVLRAHAKDLRGAVVGGAGHYVHDLQHGYLMMLLDAFTEGRPFAAARIEALD